MLPTASPTSDATMTNESHQPRISDAFTASNCASSTEIFYPSLQALASSSSTPQFVVQGPTLPSNSYSEPAHRSAQVNAVPNPHSQENLQQEHTRKRPSRAPSSSSDSATVSLSEESHFERLEDIARSKGTHTSQQVCSLRNRFWQAKKKNKLQAGGGEETLSGLNRRSVYSVYEFKNPPPTVLEKFGWASTGPSPLGLSESAQCLGSSSV